MELVEKWVHDDADIHSFVFEHEGKVKRVDLDGFLIQALAPEGETRKWAEDQARKVAFEYFWPHKQLSLDF